MKNWFISFGPGKLFNPLYKPIDIIDELFSIPTQFFINIVDKTMGKNFRAFENNLIRSIVPVIPGLTK